MAVVSLCCTLTNPTQTPSSRSRTRICLLSASLPLSHSVQGSSLRAPGRPSSHRLLPPPSELRTATACSLTSPPSRRSHRNLPSRSHRANVEASVAQVPHFSSSSSSFRYRYTAPHPQNTNPRLLPHCRKGLTQRRRCAQTPSCLRPVVCGSTLLPHSTIGMRLVALMEAQWC
ncbi:uncharacterized protein LOC107608822 isoform X3 [Arachis ipaensis]|uniref:uncharacterized protein LOC107608822 isoform X3 n=1 Tax=Arachis ipaensis TaxID=130454 RepID=UPI000A2B8D0A|nr:uncharacterized protein LOC107608822 isoform X3 [Arachis ipaensis]